MSYREKREDGKVLKGSLVDGYPVFRYKQFYRNGTDVTVKNKQIFIHKLVTEYFGKPKKDDDRYVIHLDYNKMNNHVTNLEWATKREMELHQQKKSKRD